MNKTITFTRLYGCCCCQWNHNICLWDSESTGWIWVVLIIKHRNFVDSLTSCLQNRWADHLLACKTSCLVLHAPLTCSAVTSWTWTIKHNCKCVKIRLVLLIFTTVTSKITWEPLCFTYTNYVHEAVHAVAYLEEKVLPLPFGRGTERRPHQPGDTGNEEQRAQDNGCNLHPLNYSQRDGLPLQKKNKVRHGNGLKSRKPSCCKLHRASSLLELQ